MLIHRIPTCLLALCVATATLTYAATTNAADLKWKFKEGDTLNYVMARNTEAHIDVSGQLIETTANMTFDLTWNVKKVESDGTATIEETVDRVQIKMELPFGQGVEYDSKSDKKPEGQVWDMMGPTIEAIAGQAFTLQVSPAGKVSEITLPQKLADHFAAEAAERAERREGGGDRPAGGGQGGGQGGRRGGGGGGRRGGGLFGGGAFNEVGVRRMIEQTVMPLPADGSDSWTTEIVEEQPGAGKQTTEIVYTAAGEEEVDGKKVAKVTTKSEISFEPVEEPEMDVEISDQKSDGTFYFDAAAGRLVKAEGMQSSVKEMIAPNREIIIETTEKFTIVPGKSPEGEAKSDG